MLGDVQFCPGAGIRPSRSKSRLRLAFARSGICSEHKSGQFSASSRRQKLLSLKAQLTLPIRSGAFFRICSAIASFRFWAANAGHFSSPLAISYLSIASISASRRSFAWPHAMVTAASSSATKRNGAVGLWPLLSGTSCARRSRSAWKVTSPADLAGRFATLLTNRQCQSVSSNCSVGFRCGPLVATRVPQMVEKNEGG